MRDFSKPKGRLAALPFEARLVYSVFAVFTLIALFFTLALAEDMVGVDSSRFNEYYAGTTTLEGKDSGQGPDVLLPPEVENGTSMRPMSKRKLLEVAHFHLFSMPVYLLILSHLFMLSRSSRSSKIAWIAIATLSTALHILAPFPAAYALPGTWLLYMLSGSGLLLSYAWMCVIPLYEMWG